MINLLLLPFRIIKRLVWKTIWHSVYFFLLRPRLLLLLVFGGLAIFGGYYLAAQQKSLNTPPPTINAEALSAEDASGAAESTEPKAEAAPITLPEITGKIENGNSRFAKNIFAMMNAQQQALYGKKFNEAMHTGTAEKPYRWMANTLFFGEIKVAAPFTTKTGVTCRQFDEVLKFYSVAQRKSGTACMRTTNPSWCIIPPGSVRSCDITRSGGSEQFFRNLRDLF